MKRRLFVLVSEETEEKLEKCKEALGANASEVVRKGIDKVYGDLKE